MELQAMLVLCGVGVTVGAVLLLMLLFKSSGTSYEEAVAQQRQAATELLALAESKNKNKKNTKKDKKKQAKKEKRENVAVVPSSEPESGGEGAEGDEPTPTKHHVEFSAPTVVDMHADTAPVVKIRKRGKEAKVRPILLNKEDPSVVSAPGTPAPPSPVAEQNHFELIHPKDEFELRIALEKKEEVDKKPAKPIKSSKCPKPNTELKEEAVIKAAGAGDAPKDQRKAKKEKKWSSSEDTAESPAEEVVPPLNPPQPGELTTEKLLRQVNAAPVTAPPAPPAAKTNRKKKPEPNVLALMAGDAGAVNVGELVRVVRGAALSRAEIQLLTDTLLNKQHDPLPVHSDWTEGPNDPMQKLKKQLAEKEKALTDEVEASQALHAKLKELRASLNAERARAVSAARALETGALELGATQGRLQRLQEEHHALQHENHLLQQKLSAEAEAQAQRVQMEMHIQRLSESEAALVAQLAGLQAELNARVMELGQARCEANANRDAAIMAQQHASDLAQQLQEANRMYSEAEAGRQRAQQEARQAHDKLQALAELQAEVSRLSARCAAAEKAKDEANHRHTQTLSEVAQLRQQLAARESELAARESELAEARQLAATPATAPATNGLPPQDSHKAVELAKVEAVVEGLRTELNSTQSCVVQQREQLIVLQTQLQQYQDKNNELRTKNWKVMDALQAAEKALQTKHRALPAQESSREAVESAVTAAYAETADILRAAAPSAAPANGNGKAWLQRFADSLRAELDKPAERDEPSEQNERLQELQKQNDHLQALVNKYKTIIDDTEGVLSRLQLNVSSEEARWGALLQEKQVELDALRLTRLTQEPLAFAYSCIEKSLPNIVGEMEKKIASLEAELATARAQSNKNSFADHERHAEQRLMSAVSDKHVTELSNGPSQMSLQEEK